MIVLGPDKLNCLIRFRIFKEVLLGQLEIEIIAI